MSSSREDSPDWLRCFQAPNHSVVTLSSSSDSSPNNSPIRDKEIHHGEPSLDSVSKSQDIDRNKDEVLIDSGGESPVNKARKSKASKIRKKVVNDNLGEGDGFEGEASEKEILEKPMEPQVSSRLPLVFPEKIQRLKALVECDGDSIDLSGDVGAVGRISFSSTPSGSSEMLFDLKGNIYKTTIVPSSTFCVVSFGQAEAKIEAIMNDFIQLKPHSNVYEAETMIEGTLDGFSFDSDEEGDKVPKASARQSKQNNENEDAADVKANGKGATRKRAKATGKPVKTGGRKSQGPKKPKKSKK
ncbi:DNA-binding protein BIN4 isoform X2 [Magnolia sinica]|uniref:DNA-binding protein BIN4 isoform X2 n=1 Tax=Magnolia sinica TaxID=86752 RepID=UPI00265A8EB1|nr:DNA-binding protein BIN4 isoform X2 [Magnolia sinica]